MPSARLQLVPPSLPTDEALVRALQQGQASAANAFYARTRPVVSRSILRLIRTSEDHDELVQLTMIELMMTIGRFKGQCSLDTWASTLTAHVVFKQLRQRKRERVIFSALTDDSPAYAVPAIDTPRPLHRDLLARLVAVLESIDRPKAEVFVLHEVHGFSLQETAEILGITVSNAQTRLVRGRRALNEKLGSDVELAGALENIGGQDG